MNKKNILVFFGSVIRSPESLFATVLQGHSCSDKTMATSRMHRPKKNILHCFAGGRKNTLGAPKKLNSSVTERKWRYLLLRNNILFKPYPELLIATPLYKKSSFFSRIIINNVQQSHKGKRRHSRAYLFFPVGLTSRESLCTSVTSHQAQAHPPTRVFLEREPQQPPGMKKKKIVFSNTL